MVELKLNSFFVGAGGIDLGFIKAGYEITGAWDFDEPSVKSYSENVSKVVNQADVRDLKGENIPRASVWSFGFPCQDLSKNGDMAGMVVECTECGTQFERTNEQKVCPSCSSDKYKAVTRSGMFFEIMRLLEEVDEKPEIILAENVPELRKYMGVMQDEYEKVGYKMFKVTYNSKYWNVAQNRERWFVLGVRNDIGKDFIFPVQSTDINVHLMDILEDNVSESYFIDKSKMPVFLDGPVDIPDKLKMKRPEKDWDNDEYVVVRNATKLGYDVAFVGDSVNCSHPNSETRRGRVGHGIAQTLLTSNEQVVILPGGRARKFTPRELARLQGFPDTYKQVVSTTEFTRQVGNAVTTTVAFGIADKITDFFMDIIKVDMMQVAIENGLSHPATVDISEKLDVMINAKIKSHWK